MISTIFKVLEPVNTVPLWSFRDMSDTTVKRVSDRKLLKEKLGMFDLRRGQTH